MATTSLVSVGNTKSSKAAGGRRRQQRQRRTPPPAGGFGDESIVRPYTEGLTKVIKAWYEDKIIRLRLSWKTSIEQVRETVAKKIKLPEGYHVIIEYLGGLHRWLVLTSNDQIRCCLYYAASLPHNNHILLRIWKHQISRPIVYQVFCQQPLPH